MRSSLGVLRRRRYCKNCNAGLSTFEIRGDDLERLINLLNRLSPLIQKLDDLEELLGLPNHPEQVTQKLKEIQILKSLLKDIPTSQ